MEIINGVPHVKGGIQKSLNIMDSIKIKPTHTELKKKSSKKKSSKKKLDCAFLEETEEDKKQKELLKKQMLEQYAYEYDTDEDIID